MDLDTLLSARREAEKNETIDDVAAAERALLAESGAPGSAWIHRAALVITAHQQAARPERVWPLLRVLEPRLPALGPADAGRVIAVIAAQALLEGAVESFLKHARAAAEALDRAGEPGRAAVERAALGGALLALGARDEAAAALDAALASAAAGSITMASAQLDRARLHLRDGALAEARALAEQAAEGFARRGDRRLEGIARAALATAIAGDPAALAEAHRAREALAGSPEGALAAIAIARAHLAAGAPADAAAALEDADSNAAGWLWGGAAPVWIARADARDAAGDAAGARSALAEAKRAALAFASRLRDAGLRRTYLERVPDHRRALALDPL